MPDVKAIIKQAQRRFTTVEVCLRGDLAGEYEQLERQVAKLAKSTKLGGDPERSRLRAEMDRLRQEMTDGTVEFKLHALSDAAFQRLADEHPPRRNGDDIDPRDAETGFDRSTFYRALIRASTIEPTLDDEDWELLLGEDGISPGQMMRLRTEAMAINGRDVDVPFSPGDSGTNPD